MKRFFVSLMIAAMSLFAADAQTRSNAVADSILGDYQSIQGEDSYKVHVTKNANGTYKAQIFWLKDALDKNGNKRLDSKNPDKSLRNVPSDKIVLIDQLRYNAEKQQWDGAKIYDPQRGLKANAVLRFEGAKLKVKGNFGPFSDTAFWTPLSK